MKIIWTESLIKHWIDRLIVFTGAEFNYTIVLDEKRRYGKVDTQKRIFYFPVRRFNHVDVPNNHVLLCLTYLYGLFSELNLSLTVRSTPHTELVIKNICDNFGINFKTRAEIEIESMHIDRMLYNDADATLYHVGDLVVKHFSIIRYKVVNVESVINGKRNITISSNYDTLTLDEEDLIRDYHLLGTPNSENDK